MPRPLFGDNLVEQRSRVDPPTRLDPVTSGQREPGREDRHMFGTIGTIIGWIVLGLVAGFIARAVVPGKDDIGILRTIILGVVGSIVGGFLWGLITGGLADFQPAGWIGSIIGAIIVLVIYNKVTGRKRVRR